MKWPTFSLEEVASVQRGKFSARPRNDPKYYGGDIPFIQTGDVAKSTGFVRSYIQTLNTEGLSVSKLFPRGSLAITIAANIGDVAQVDFDFACPDSLVVAQAKNGICIDWLRYCLQNKKETLERLAPQNAQKNINLEVLRPLPLDVPPFQEQEKIAAVLLAWDRAIDLTERLLTEKRLCRKGLMQQLLTGKRRLPGFGKPAVGDNLPKGWQRPKTEEIFQNISRKNRSGETVLSVTQDEGVVPRDSLDRKINMDQEKTHTYKLVKPGDFVISLRSFQGGLEYSRHRGLVSPAYHVIRAKVDVSDDFYRHYFKSPEFIQRLAIATIGIRDGKQISYGDFSFMRLPVPPVKEQHAISEVINQVDRELGLLQASGSRFELTY